MGVRQASRWAEPVKTAKIGLKVEVGRAPSPPSPSLTGRVIT